MQNNLPIEQQIHGNNDPLEQVPINVNLAQIDVVVENQQPQNVFEMTQENFTKAVTQIIKCIRRGNQLKCNFRIQTEDPEIREIRSTEGRRIRCSDDQIAILKLIISAHRNREIKLHTDHPRLPRIAEKFVNSYVASNVITFINTDNVLGANDYLHFDNMLAIDTLIGLRRLTRDLSSSLEISPELPCRAWIKLLIWIASLASTGIKLRYAWQNNLPDCKLTDFLKEIPDDQDHIYQTLCNSHLFFFWSLMISAIILAVTNALFVVYSFDDVLKRLCCCCKCCFNISNLTKLKAKIWLFSSIFILAASIVYLTSYILLLVAKSHIHELPDVIEEKVLSQLKASELLDFLSSLLSDLISMILNVFLYNDISKEVKELVRSIKQKCCRCCLGCFFRCQGLICWRTGCCFCCYH